MQEYVERSFAFAVRLVVNIFDLDVKVPERLTVEDGRKLVDSDIFNKAYDYLIREMQQAIQALITNLVTLQSRSGGQLPFTSINLGLNTSEEGRLVQSIFLDELEKGIGRFDRTAIFPITCWQIKEGINKYPNDPNFDLLMRAMVVANKRLYPTFVNCDWSENKGQTLEEELNIMGCRTIVGKNINDNTYKKEGRGNLAPVTINLAYLGLKYGKDINRLNSELDKLLHYARESLLIRYDIMKTQHPSVAPFMYQNATIMDGENCEDTVESALKNGTLVFGYIGLAECVKAITGYYHNENEEAQKLGVSIIKRMREYADKSKAELNINFAVYATPAEGLCYKTIKSLRDEFGVVEGITDKEYLTNSHHIPVHCGENFFKKADIESEYSSLANGGNIFHIEIDGRNCNEKAMYEMLLYSLDKNIPYVRFSHPISTCLDCGYNLPALMEKCEKCGSENVENLAIVTGYLTVDVKNMNKGKQDEVKHRELNI